MKSAIIFLLLTSAAFAQTPALTQTGSCSTRTACPVSGDPGLVYFHGSSGGSPVDPTGDLYQLHGDTTMDCRNDTITSLVIQKDVGTLGQQTLEIKAFDDIPQLVSGTFETAWFGYKGSASCSSSSSLTYPYTQARMDYLYPLMIAAYTPNLNKMYAYGNSMGTLAVAQWALKKTDTFAALFMDRGLWQSKRLTLPQVHSIADGQTSVDATGLHLPTGELYSDYQDSVPYISSGCPKIPPVMISTARQDETENPTGSTWAENTRAIAAMKACHDFYAVVWNDSIHSGVPSATQQYLTSFALNVSYPVFANWSLDAAIGNGTYTDGDCYNATPSTTPVCWVNHGWTWTVGTDTATVWAATLNNSDGTGTTDITPRNTQTFAPTAGRAFTWTATGAQSGSGTADSNGLVTASTVTISGSTTITFTLTAVPGAAMTPNSKVAGNSVMH